MERLTHLRAWWSTKEDVAIRLRAALLDAPALISLWRATNQAVDILHRTCAQEAPGTECNHTADQHVLMFFGCRSLTSTLAALRLLSTGYYLQALTVERDLLESTLLLQLFATQPDAIGRWRTADARTRTKHFAPRAISEALAAVGVSTRYDVYREYCELASHPSGASRILTWRRDLKRHAVGPFFELETARRVLLDITLNSCDACHSILDALSVREAFADDWAAIEAAIDEWNAAPEK